VELATGSEARFAARKSTLGKLQAKMKRLGFLKILGLGVLSLGVLGIIIWGTSAVLNAQSSPQAIPSQQVQLNVPYSLQARDSQLHIINSKLLNMKISRAEKTDTVLIQGQRSRTINGKSFLILYFDIDNPDNQLYFTNTNDLFRLVDQSGKRVAPAVHQGTIDIRPDATKSSEVGFVMDKGSNKFTIEIGQTDGRKKTIEINFAAGS